MKSFGRTIAALVAAAGLFGYIYFVESKKDPAAIGAGATDGGASPKREKVFTGFDKTKVMSLTLRKRSGDVVQAEKKGETWTLLSPHEVAADPAEIGSLLSSLETLETEDIVSDNATDLPSFGLSPPKVAVSVVALGASKPFEFELGDNVPAGASVFARVPGNPRLFTVSSMMENTLNKSAFDLRNRNVVSIKRDDIKSIEVQNKPKDGFKLVRGEKGFDEWKLTAPIATRAARWTVDSFIGLIENLRMESLTTETATPQDLAKFGLGPEARRITLGREGSAPVVLEIGKKSEAGPYYARVASSKTVSLIGTGLIDDLDKGLKNVRATRLLDVAAYEVNGFEVIAGGATRTFAKSTTKGKDGVDAIAWKGTAPSKDATQEKVSDALFAIGGLDAAEFIDAPKPLVTYGLDAPQLRVVVRFEGDKKEDWFEVSIKGDAAFARRRDDASVLKLDKAKTEALIKNFSALGQ